MSEKPQEAGHKLGEGNPEEGKDTSEPVLSVLMPAYNEEATIEEILERVLATPFDKEVVVIDDGSIDRTAEIAEGYSESNVRLVRHDRNRGKGAAVRTGIEAARGQMVLIQDADLEYDPECYGDLLEPLLEGAADVVYGSRFLGGPHRVLYFWHHMANKLLTFWSDLWSNLDLSDVESGYKAFRKETLEGLDLKENSFGIEIELTQKLARRRWRIYEVPISYYGRTYEEGKKIGFTDALRAFWCVMRYRLAD